MEQLSNIDIMSIVSFTVSIVSVALAVVSIVFSAIFFRWGKEENEANSKLTAEISEKVACLEKLFDKMYDSTYQIVRENNQAMQRHLFPGSFESQTIENRDMDVFLLIDSKQKISKTDICTELNITPNIADTIISRMVERGRAKIDADGETIIAVRNSIGLTSSSEEFDSESAKAS